MLGVMKILQVEIGLNRFSLLNTFDRLVGLTFCWREIDVDGYDAVKHGQGFESQLYFKILCTLDETTIEKVGLLCSKCSDARRIWDGPNARPLLKFYMHTDPLHGHASFVSHVTFETSHEPLK